MERSSFWGKGVVFCSLFVPSIEKGNVVDCKTLVQYHTNIILMFFGHEY